MGWSCHHDSEYMAVSERELSLDWQTRRLRPALADLPVTTSRSFGWDGVTLEQYRVSDFDTGEIAHLKHVVALQLSGSLGIEWKVDGKTTRHTITAGSVSVVPAHLPHSCRSGDSGEFVLLLLDPRFLQLHSPVGDVGIGPELAVTLGVADPLILGLAQAFLAEVQSGGPGGRIYIETLAAGLAVHLAGRFGNRFLAQQNRGTVRSRREVRKAIEFIHSNLERDFALVDMATAVGLSPFHFSRVFKKATGLSPYQFVLRQRIQKAKELLLDGRETLAGVAVRVGFCDQSHFTSHFKRVCGVTPKQFADRMSVGIQRDTEAGEAGGGRG